MSDEPRGRAGAARSAAVRTRARFFDAWLEDVYAFVRRASGSEAEAEAIVRAAFVRARDTFHELDTARDARAWIFDGVVSALRSRELSRLAAGTSAPALADPLEAALVALPIEARMLVLLRATAGFSPRAAAQLLELDEKGAEELHRHALAELRAHAGGARTSD